MLLADFLKQGTAALESLYPRPEASSMMSLLVGERLGVSTWQHIVEPMTEIPSDAMEGLRSDMKRLLAAEPLQYVLGACEFYSFRFKVSPAVLIPRPETELLVQEAVALAGAKMKANGGCKVLDLCTGSGCIAWSLALEVPGCEVDAADISAEALRLARMQYLTIGCEASLSPHFMQIDVLDIEHIPNLGQYDLILSNPPYVTLRERSSMRPNVLDYEPGLALFVPDDDPLLFYRALARWAERLLKKDGNAIFEINESYPEQTAAVFAEAGFADSRAWKDLSGRFRFVRF